MKLVIESAETGVVLNMRMEDSVEQLKGQIHLLTSIAPQDQILLIGPPYKILDNQYGPKLKVEGKRIFVFNRRIITDLSKEPNRVRLLPIDIPDLDALSESLSSGGGSRGSANSNLSSTFSALRLNPQYELLTESDRFFQEQVKKGQCYATFLRESRKACKDCVQQHSVQLEGMTAAINNLKETYHSISKPFEILEKKLRKQQNYHKSLLSKFDASIERLSLVPLHPSITLALESYEVMVGSRATDASPASSGARVGSAGAGTVAQAPSSSSGHKNLSLFDTIPIERERAYQRQCADNYTQVENQLNRIRSLYEDISASVLRLQAPPVDMDSLSATLQTVNNEDDAQVHAMNTLRRHYQFVYETISNATSNSPRMSIDPENDESVDSSAAVAAAAAAGEGRAAEATAAEIEQRLRDLRVESEGVLERLNNSVCIVKDCKNSLEKSQNIVVRSMYQLMRNIANLQTDIQYKLKRDVEWMKKWSGSQNEYFLHLEYIAELPNIYNQLLIELVRRKRYNNLFTSEVKAVMERVTVFRSEEIAKREAFMSCFGLHLPPVFFKAIPTLKEKPPHFNATVTEEQWLPDIDYEDLPKPDRLVPTHHYSDSGGGAGGSITSATTTTTTAGAAQAAQGQLADAAVASATIQYGQESEFATVGTGTGTARVRVESFGLDDTSTTPIGGGGQQPSISSTAAGSVTGTPLSASMLYQATPTPHPQPGSSPSQQLQMLQQQRDTSASNEQYLYSKVEHLQYENSVLLATVAQLTVQVKNLTKQLANKPPPLSQKPETAGSASAPTTTSDSTNTNTHTAAAPVKPVVEEASLRKERPNSVDVATSPLNTESNTAAAAGGSVGEGEVEPFSGAAVATLVRKFEEKTAAAAAAADADASPPPAVDTAAGNSDAEQSNTGTTATIAPLQVPASATNATISSAYSAEAAAARYAATTEGEEEEESEDNMDGLSANDIIEGLKFLNDLLLKDTQVSSYAQDHSKPLDLAEVECRALAPASNAHGLLTTLSRASSSNSSSSMMASVSPVLSIAATAGGGLDSSMATPEEEVGVVGVAAKSTSNNSSSADTAAHIVSLFRKTAASSHALIEAFSYRLQSIMLSFLSFEVDDVALFIPTAENGKIWLAFNSGCPHYYLSVESLDAFLTNKKASQRRLVHIVGRIIFIQDFVATSDCNPYNVQLGTVYHVCTVRQLLKTETVESMRRARMNAVKAGSSFASAVGSTVNKGQQQIVSASTRAAAAAGTPGRKQSGGTSNSRAAGAAVLLGEATSSVATVEASPNNNNNTAMNTSTMGAFVCDDNISSSSSRNSSSSATNTNVNMTSSQVAAIVHSPTSTGVSSSQQYNQQPKAQSGKF